jgi:hypothetical protein
MGERNDVNGPARELGSEGDTTDERGGYRIPGRDFAGSSIASTEREQTDDHRGESHRHRMDDAVVGDEDRGERSRDES